jgi:hypothetical protein
LVFLLLFQVPGSFGVSESCSVYSTCTHRVPFQEQVLYLSYSDQSSTRIKNNTTLFVLNDLEGVGSNHVGDSRWGFGSIFRNQRTQPSRQRLLSRVCRLTQGKVFQEKALFHTVMEKSRNGKFYHYQQRFMTVIRNLVMR